MNPPIQCPQCRARLLAGMFNQPDLKPCPACQAPLQVEIFPALFRKLNAGTSAEAIMVEGESSCFYHSQKKAVRPCDGCGRFVCALCDCELNGQHFCPACLESGKTKGKIKSIENQRTLHDHVALALAVYPLLFFYLTIVTAPMALFIAIRHWKSPASIVGGKKTRFVIAIIVALFEIAAWIAFFIILAVAKKSS